MASGRLGKGAAGSAGLPVSIYAVPGAAQYATVNILVCNTTAAVRRIRLAIATSSAATATDWIDYDLEIPPNGTRERTAIVLNPGEHVLAQADAAGVVVRVHGHEKL